MSFSLANEYRERVVETEGGTQRSTARRISGSHATRNFAGIPDDLLFEDRCQRCSGVFDINIKIARSHCLFADKRSAQIQPAFHLEPGLALDGLRHDLSKNQLLGEIL